MKRDVRIDTLRALAILLIMYAHTRPPQWLYKLRNFDVILMTFILGASYYLSTERKKKPKPYFSYLKERFLRLIIPVWIFLTLFFLVLFGFTSIVDQPFPFSLRTIFTSYSLIWGIGYIWIIRVFFIIAILSPFLYWLAKKTTHLLPQLGVIGLFLLLQNGLNALVTLLSGTEQAIFEQYGAISFGYLLAALVGMWAVRQNNKENSILLICFSILFFIIATYQTLPSIEDNKYPPTIYFISYGLAGSLLLFQLTSFQTIRKLLEKTPGINWLSQHSLELYYWHLFPIIYFNLFVERDSWLLRFFIVFPVAFLLTFLQNRYIPHLFQPQKR